MHVDILISGDKTDSVFHRFHRKIPKQSAKPRMFFIAQKKVIDQICNSKDILANINLDLKLLRDHFVHLVASSNLASLEMMIAIG